MEKGSVETGLIRRYIRRELTPGEMYALERQAQDDPMLMDIMRGMEHGTPDTHADNLAEIQKRITTRTHRQRSGVSQPGPAQRWAIAASALSVGTWWFAGQEIAEEQETRVTAVASDAPQTAADRSDTNP